jgi:hypothetical protein
MDAILGDYKLINPLAYNAIKLSSNSNFQESFSLLSPSDILFSDNKIGLLKSTNLDVTPDYDELTNLTSSFLSWVRFFSFQTQISSVTHIEAIFPSVDITDTLPIIQTYGSGLEGFTRAYIYETSITEEIINKSASKVKNGEAVPVFYQFLLDGYSNYDTSDYRQCFLNLAISVESYLGIKLDEEYEKRISGSGGPEIRIINIPRAGGKFIKKDPIYESLASGTNFSTLLHQRPLYLLGKSLLIDNPETYKLAMMLYATRNKIVHRGELSEQDVTTCFSLTKKDADKALNCVKDVFGWFGDKIVYPRQDVLLPYWHVDQ